MNTVFGIIGDVIGLLDGFKVIGNISIFHILIAGLVATVIIKLIKGRGQ